jgi:hypothetical protein
MSQNSSNKKGRPRSFPLAKVSTKQKDSSNDMVAYMEESDELLWYIGEGRQLSWHAGQPP